MKILKMLLIAGGGIFFFLLIILIFVPDPEESTTESAADETAIEAESSDSFYDSSDQSKDEAENNATTASNGKVTKISQAQFKKLVANYAANKDAYIGQGPCIVDFYAEWCGPCRQLSPILAKMAKKYTGINFYKIDIDEAASLTETYGINSIPTLFFCYNGNIESITGVPSEDELEEYINSIQQ